MDTIKRLGEQETLNRIVTGTLKSYVDHDIDSVDTSQFLNLETLNVPKAESVVIGEGVKDTLEVLNAPKMEEVTVDSGEKSLVVNWGKCGGNEDVVVTYKEGDGIWIPETFFGSGTEIRPLYAHHRPSTLTETPQLGRVATFNDKFNEYSGSWISVYRLPQELGKWLYDNAESVTSTHPTAYLQGLDSLKLWKAWAYYPDTVSNWTSSNASKAWGFALRKGSEIGVRGKDYQGNLVTSATTLGDLTESFKKETAEWAHINPNDYYIVAEISTSFYIGAFGYTQTDLTEKIYLRHWNTLDSIPTASTKGESVKVPSSLATTLVLNNDLSNLPNLKVADVHTMDVDVPMFKGCTNLERATVGGKKNPTEVEGATTYPTLDSSYFEGCDNLKEVTITNPELRVGNAIPKAMKVNWGKCGGTEDVIVTYKEGEGLWIPRVFIEQAFGSDKCVIEDKLDKNVGYQGIVGVSGDFGKLVYKLPSELGEYLYTNAETKNGNFYTETLANASNIYKGIAIYPDAPDSWSEVGSWGVGIRTKDDLHKRLSNTDASNITIPSTFRDELESGVHYLVIEACINDDDHAGYAINGQLQVCFASVDDTNDHIYLRKSKNGAPSSTSLGAKYLVDSTMTKVSATLYADESKVPVEEQPLVLCRPQKNVYYSKTKKKDSFTVNWGEGQGGTVTYRKGEPLWIPREFLETALDDEKVPISVTEVTGEVGYQCTSPMGNSVCPVCIYRLPDNLGEYLYNVAESSNVGYYGKTAQINQGRLYKGIAVYPDTLASGYSWRDRASSSDPYASDGWGVGIRRKNDITCEGLAPDGTHTEFTPTDFPLGDLPDDGYYLVFQSSGAKRYLNLTGLLQNALDAFGDNRIYFRTWKELTSVPSATNQGSKYTVPVELCTEPLQITMAEYLKENNPNYDFRER